MTRARQQQIILSETPWYHLVNRCVRRAFLCGVDSISGQNYGHRREWIEQLMFKLASVFSVDIAAFAVMSNHYHLVIRVDADQAQNWSDQEVFERWTQLFTGPSYLQTYLNQPERSPAAMQPKIDELAQTYRERLMDLSWYMRTLNESIARMANKEDGVKGHFWEGRFKSQALLDEQAILSVMAYVDLNPVRAAMSETLTESDHTSIQRRLQAILGTQPKSSEPELDVEALHLSKGAQSFLEGVLDLPTSPLMDFNPHNQNDDRGSKQIQFALEDYIEFVDYLGHAIHPHKHGHIPEAIPRLMSQLNFTDKLIEQMQQGRLLNSFGSAIGNLTHLKNRQTQRHQAFNKGNKQAKAVFA